MFDYDSWQEIWATMRKNRLRTVLTAWGVFWGIFLLVVALGFALGLRHKVISGMGGTAYNAVFVWGQRTSKAYAGLRPGRPIRFDNADIEALEQLEGIDDLAPRLQQGGFRSGTTVVRGDNSGSYEIMGDVPAFEHVQPMTFTRGRFINRLDIDERRKVAIIGETVVDQLFERGENPIGEAIRIRGVSFVVVGTFRPLADGERGERQSQTIFIPFTTFQQAFNAHDQVHWFTMTADPKIDPTVVEERVRAVLGRNHKIAPDDRQGIGSFNAGEEFRKLQTLFSGIELMMWLVGITTLLFGALGVSNIMLIAVKERTKEIGVRKALGARPRHIIGMVMSEAVFLTTLAGYFGMLAGIGAIELFNKYFAEVADGLVPMVQVKVAVLALGALVVSGAVAGIIPARHAARINPIESLRAE